MAELFTPAAPQSPAELRRRFVLLTTDHVELVLLRELDPVLEREAPGLDLHSRPISTAAVDELREARADLAFGVFGELPRDVRRLPLFEDRLVSLVRAGHPLLRGRLTPERLGAASHVLVAPRGEARGVLDDQLARLGLSRRVARTLATFLPAPFLVAGSDRVVTLSFRLAALLGPLLHLRRLEPPERLALRPYRIEALWHRRSDDDAGHRFLRETLLGVAARLPPITQPRRAPDRRPR
jgi:DNA-binding transcriptional LysR family regulator